MPSWDKIFQRVRDETRHSRYVLRPPLDLVPWCLDCVTFVTWSYELVGVSLIEWIPGDPKTIAHGVTPPLCLMADMGAEINVANMNQGDLVITAGIGRFHHPGYGSLGHIGIVTDTNTIIHATRRACGMLEEPYEQFIAHHGPLRTIRRIMS